MVPMLLPLLPEKLQQSHKRASPLTFILPTNQLGFSQPTPYCDFATCHQTSIRTKLNVLPVFKNPTKQYLPYNAQHGMIDTDA
jgi:hypothetical protein